MASNPMRSRIALFVTVVLAGIVSVAAAAWSSGHEAVPSRFAIAAPREGDAWNYTITGLDGNVLTGPNGEREVRLDLTRTGPLGLLDADGKPRAAQGLDVLHLYAHGDDLVGRLARFATAGAETVASTDLDQVGGNSEFGVVTGIPELDALVVDRELQSTWTTNYVHQAPCGHWSSLQGEAGKTNRIEVAGCRPHGWKTVGFVDGLLVVQGKDDGGHRTQLSFAADVPIPVRVLQPSWWDANITVAWTLYSFTRGGEPAAAPPLPNPAPAVAFAPRQPFGPDEAGVTHPFPLSQAYGIATASGPLATFMANRPGAYLQSASFQELIDDLDKPRNHTYRWTLQATDGIAAAKVAVERSYPVPNENGLEAIVRENLPVQPSDRVLDRAPDKGPFPVAARLPNQLPTVASVMQRALAYAASPMPGNAWGFAFTCADASCTEAQSVVLAGHDDEYREGQHVGAAFVVMFRRTADLIGVDGTGTTVLHEVAYVDAYEATTIGPYTVQGGGQRPEFLKASEATGAAWDWNRGAAAGGAVLGLAAVALATKLLLGLWHRSTPDHPTRTQLLQLLEAEPGLHHKEIMRRLGKGNSVVAHHLRALERSGQVISRQGPRYRCYFVAGMDRRVADAAPWTKSPLAQRILDELVKGPCTGQELAARLGVAPSSIAFHVRRFQEARLLTSSRDGRIVRLTATESGLHAASTA